MDCKRYKSWLSDAVAGALDLLGAVLDELVSRFDMVLIDAHAFQHLREQIGMVLNILLRCVTENFDGSQARLENRFAPGEAVIDT